MTIDTIIKEIDRLKPVSSLSSRIMEITSNPESSLAELVEVVTYDQILTANLLKICNSSYYGFQNEIVSVKQAVNYLGMEKVASLAILESNADNFKDAQIGYELDEGELWRYSVSSALIAQSLAEKRHLANASLIFTAALIKDIGKVILSSHVAESFKEISRRVKGKGLTFIEAEKEVIGIDHAELGARVAEAWHFSPDLVNIIRHHHTPMASAQGNPGLSIVYLADTICMMIGIGVGSDGLTYRYYPEVTEQLDFSAVDLQKTIADFWEKLKHVESLVQFAQGDSDGI